MPAPRVRFAPSPTGYLHVGGARTALFNWLFVKQTGGTFVLRIEDTDKQRSSDAHTQVILDGLTWLGITWDEGPLFQGEYAARHRADAERLLAEGKAYRDFMTAEELDVERKKADASGRPFRYERALYGVSDTESERRAARGDPFAIRFAVPEGEIAWVDAVHGRISFQGADVDDFVILRSDGTAIYNLAVVSDDIDMRITHVIRGDDHVSNTPKQIALYRALGYEPPQFAHVPMILGTDGKKLSKRHGATAVGDYQDQGIYAPAMRNFLALLGWSPGDDLEILPEPEMIRRFTLEAIQSKPAVFDTTKLEWMNGQYLSQLDAEALVPDVQRQLQRSGITIGDANLVPYVNACKARSRTIIHLAAQVASRLPGAPVVRDAKGDALVTKLGAAFASNLKQALTALEPMPDELWKPEPLLATLTTVSETGGLKLGDVMQPVRVALTGGTVSEPVNELLAVVGRSESLARIRQTIAS